MKNYGIVRCEKLKMSDGGGLYGRTSHNLRQFENKFDKKLSALNEYGGETSVKGIKQSLKEKWGNLSGNPRKDAVGSLEVICTTTANALETKSEKQFFEDCKKELESWYGKDNLIAWQIHRDETTPHLHAIICPIETKIVKKNRLSEAEKLLPLEQQPKFEKTVLNAQKIMGGRDSLRKVQNDFYKNVFKNYGLNRGEVGSKKKNTRSSLKKRDENITKKEKLLKEQEKNLVDSATEKYREEVKKEWKNDYVQAKDDLPKPKFRESAKHYRNRIIPDFDTWVKYANKQRLENEKIISNLEKTVEKKTDKINKTLKLNKENYNKWVREHTSEYQKLLNINNKLSENLKESESKLLEWRRKTPEDLVNTANYLHENGFKNGEESLKNRNRDNSRGR